MTELLDEEIQNIQKQLEIANKELSELYKGDFEPLSEQDVKRIDEISETIDTLISRLEDIIKNI